MTDQPTTRPRIRLWVRLLLVASLGFNLLVVGLVIGAKARPDHFDRPAHVERSLPYTRALTHEDRHALGRKMRDRATALPRQSREDRAKAYAAAVELLRADNFDKAAFAVTLERQFSASASRQQIARDVLLEHISGMSAQDRAAYADRLEETLRVRTR